MIKTIIVSILLCWGEVCYSADNTSPNPTLTPGDTYTTSSKIACSALTGSEPTSIRNVPVSIKKEVFASYGIPKGNHTGYCSSPKGCELDHLISLKLGGSNSVKNLWPQSYAGKWNAIDKDNLEKRLIARVCRTSKIHPLKLPIKVAQKAIATNWIKAYQTYVVGNK